MEYCVILEQVYELNTDEDMDAAKRAVLDAELESIPVYSGDPYDGNSESVKTSKRVFAHVRTAQEQEEYDQSPYAAKNT